MNTSSHFLLGILCLVALGILGFFTIAKSDFTLFGDVQQLVVRFPQADGLREGDSVLIAGVRWGKVTSIAYHPDEKDLMQRIEVILSLDEPVELREGHIFLIEDATLLGGKNLTIDPGPAGSPVVSSDTIFLGDVKPNMIEAAGDLIAGNSDSVTEAISGIRDLVKGVQAGEGTIGKFFNDKQLEADVERIAKGFADTGENLSKITGRLEQGEGTFGKLFASDELYVSLKQIATDFSTFITEANGAVVDLRAGKGTLGAIMTDETMKEDFRVAVRDLRAIIERANNGEGTLGKILVEDSIAVNIDTVLKRLAEGDGTLGRLLTQDDIYNDIEQITSDLADVVATVREGRGTIGKLVMEEQLYYEILKAIGLLTRSLEEYREAAPISTVTSVIFGAF